MARVALQEYLSEARELINTQAFDEAIAICRHILLRYPKHIRTYQILGEACLEKGETDEAIAVFKRLLEHADPENFSAYAGLGVAYEDLGQLPQAIWYMERAFELAPNNEDARNALKRLYQKRDGCEPDRLRHNKVALARLYSRGGQYQQAIQELRQVLESEPAPGRLDLRLSLAEVLWRDGRREQAADAVRSILQTAPDCLKAILILGKILIEKGRRDEGVAVLVRTRALDPENVVAQSLFGADSPLLPESVLLPRIRPEAQLEPIQAQPQETSVPADVTEPAAVPELTPVTALEPMGEVAAASAEAAVTATTVEQVALEAPIAAVTEVGQTEPSALVGEPIEAVPEAPPVADQVQTEVAQEVLPASVQQHADTGEVRPPASVEPVQEPIPPAALAGVVVPSAEADGLLLAPPPVQQLAAVAEPTVEEEPPVAELVSPIAATAVAPVAQEPMAASVSATEPAATAPISEESVGAQALPSPELAVTELTAPASGGTGAVRKRRKKAEPPPLEAMAGVSAGLLSEIERCRQQLEVKPKDDDARLSLARAYRDAAQVKLALQEYDTLVHSKTKRTADVVADMEGLVASRPDNLEAHELLADAYAKNGQLQQALQRYRWVMERMRQPS